MGRERGVVRRDVPAWPRRGEPLQRMTFTTVQRAGRTGLPRRCPSGARAGSARGQRLSVGLAHGGDSPPQLVCGADPAVWAAGNRGSPSASAVAWQAPLGCWGGCKNLQDRTLGLCESANFFFGWVHIRASFRKKERKKEQGLPRILLLLHMFKYCRVSKKKKNSTSHTSFWKSPNLN